MAYEGEIVKMENGRWARFQRLSILNSGHQEHDDYSILVAVELDEHYQDLLSAAEQSLEEYRRRGVPVQIHLDPNGKGKISLTFEGDGQQAAQITH
jgi:hypothetical protein